MVFSSDPISAMPEFAADALPPPRSPFDEAQAEVAPPCCWQCMRDIVDLPLKARFCPRCGVNLLDGAGRVLPIPRAAAAAAMAPPDAPISAYTEEGCQRIAAWLALRAVLANAFASHPPTPTCVAGQRTQIVTGYANAMYHLGARYESGLPARRMPGEAVRCFIKSARLGNADARERLNATDS